MKGVLLAGGTGSRLDPLTRITNKHLLPVYDRPMIMYALETLRAAGISDVMVVTGSDHVDDFRRLLGDDLAYGKQERPGGIAEALGLAREFAAGDRIIVMLADNIFAGSITQTIRNFEQQPDGARVLLAHVRETEHLRHLGVPRIEDGRIVEIVEKPVDPPGKHAVTGVYCYDADVFEGYWGDAGESIDAYYEVIERVRRPHFGSDRTRLIPLQRYEDARGWLAEIARTSGLPKPIRQTNVSL